MGLQDRDYYWEKHDALTHGSKQRKKRRNNGIVFLFYPLIALAGLWYGADAYLKYQATGKVISLPPILSVPSPDPTIPVSPIKPNVADPRAGGITLKADRQGHFRGTALINGIPMPFLIDTGATKTVIPAKMAITARLPYGRYVQANTAGGKVAERETIINTIQIGNAVIRNLDAHTNAHLDEVLIGMNTLKYFRMTQEGKTLSLVANNKTINSVAQVPPGNFDTVASNQPIKKPVTIKKTVTCDARQVCTTKYSDR